MPGLPNIDFITVSAYQRNVLIFQPTGMFLLNHLINARNDDAEKFYLKIT